jgi:hypothetical protein
VQFSHYSAFIHCIIFSRIIIILVVHFALYSEFLHCNNSNALFPLLSSRSDVITLGRVAGVYPNIVVFILYDHFSLAHRFERLNPSLPSCLAFPSAAAIIPTDYGLSLRSIGDGLMLSLSQWHQDYGIQANNADIGRSPGIRQNSQTNK